MTTQEIIIIAIGLALDAFAVSIGGGAQGQLHSKRDAARLAFHLGLFQFLMPIIGWFLGSQISNIIAEYDHWIAFSLLVFIGGKMIKEAYDETKQYKTNPSKGITLVLLSIATSIDALAVGFSLALLDIRILFPSLIIGVITATMSLMGIYLGKKFGEKFGSKMEIIGGMILIGIGIKILIEHLSEF